MRQDLIQSVPRRGARCRPEACRRSGFTLVEMLVSLTIAALLVVSAVSATRALTGTRASVDQRMERSAAARQALEAIVSALRNVRRDPIQRQPVLVGTSGGSQTGNDRIDLLVISDHRARADGAESDQYEVSFQLSSRPGTPLSALVCRKDHGLDDRPDQGGLVTVVAEGIVSLSFAYLSGDQWLNEWPALSPKPPEAVRVTLQAVTPQADSTPTGSQRPEVTTLSTIVPIRVSQPASERPQRGTEEAQPETGGPKNE